MLIYPEGQLKWYIPTLVTMIVAKLSRKHPVLWIPRIHYHERFEVITAVFLNIQVYSDVT
jgi:hypothetical protein